MTQMVIVARNCSNKKPTFLAYSWTTGVVEVNIPNRIKTEDDAMAYAMYLSRHGRQDEAEMFLDSYCA